jgi:hypothetical protein
VKVSETHFDVDSDPSEDSPLAAQVTVVNQTTAVATAAPGAGAGTEMETDSVAVLGANTGSTGASETKEATIVQAKTEMEVDAPPTPAPEPPIAEVPVSSQPTPEAPPSSAPVAPPKNEIKKRSHKKKGRNQYTRDLDGSRDEHSPARSQSRDIAKEDSHNGNNGHTNGHAGNGHGNGNGNGKSHGHDRTSHAKAGGRHHGMNSKVTMSDMKRRAAALLDFISRTQLELAGEATPPEGTAGDGAAGSAVKSPVNGVVAADSPVNGEASTSTAVPNGVVEIDKDKNKDFGDLNCMEMMDSLTRRLVKWQQEYAQQV